MVEPAMQPGRGMLVYGTQRPLGPLALG